MNDRENYQNIENQILAPYAQFSSRTLGRKYDEPECTFRSPFYRDLGRIIHSTAFRLLEYKTQVFVNHEGDYYRTRLTHSLEVGQMSVGLARILCVNQDLAHTIALAHDLGHTPFGHPGEMAMNELMEDEGGFEHNVQSYRVVTRLEERYPNFSGLNLSYEVLEGIVKHTTDYDSPTIPSDFKDLGYPTIEAQIVNYADQIAFMNHDLDDGLHWGMLSIDSLKEVPLWAETFFEVSKEIPAATERIKRCRTISNLINVLIDDIQKITKKNILEKRIKTVEDIRERGKNLVKFSDEIQKKATEAKAFLLENVYYHPKVKETAARSQKIIKDLFNAYKADPGKLPEKFRLRYQENGSTRHLADYIAGMTDRFAIQEHQKLFGKK